MLYLLLPLCTGLSIELVHQVDDIEEPAAPAIADASQLERALSCLRTV